MNIYLSKIYQLSMRLGMPFFVALLIPMLLTMLEVEEYLMLVNILNSAFFLIASLTAFLLLLYATRFKIDNKISEVIWLVLFIQATVTHAALAINATLGSSTDHIPRALLVCAFIPTCFIVLTSFLSIITNHFWSDHA